MLLTFEKRCDIIYLSQKCNRKEVSIVVNVNKLKGKFVEKGYSVSQISNGTGIAVHTLYRRLNNPCEFTIGEADMIVNFLKLTAAEATDIFFNQYVA